MSLVRRDNKERDWPDLHRASQVIKLSISISKPKDWPSRFLTEESLFRSDMEARLWPDTVVLLACICAACSAHLEVLTLSTCLYCSQVAAKSLLVRPAAAVACFLDQQSSLQGRTTQIPCTTLSGCVGFVHAPSIAVPSRRKCYSPEPHRRRSRGCWQASELSSSAPDQAADQVAERRQVLPPQCPC